MKKDQIVESTRKLFNKYGYKKVTMDEIAKESGVTKKTVYSYFQSKEELLKYFINEEIINMKEIIDEIEKEDIPFFDKIHKGICELINYRNNDEFIQNITKECEIFNNPIVHENLKLIDKTVQNYIKEKLIFAEEKGFIKVDDIEIAAFLIYKMYIVLMFEWENEKFDNSKLADNIIKILKNGIERKDIQ